MRRFRQNRNTRLSNKQCARNHRNPHSVIVKTESDTPRWFRWLEAVAIIAAFVALTFTVYDNRLNRAALQEQRIAIDEQRQAFEEERIARAWAIVGTETPGNSGKVAALETLYANDIPLRGIDFSCERMGGEWDKNKQSCKTPTYLVKLNLAGIQDKTSENWAKRADLWGANLSGANLYRANLNGAHLSLANLSGVNLSFASLSGADLWGANFSRARLEATNLSGANLGDSNLSGTYLGNTSLSGAELWNANLSRANLVIANFSGADLRGANFSGAELWDANLSGAQLGYTQFCDEKDTCAHNLTVEQIQSTWAFADQWEPDNLPTSLKDGPQDTWPSPVLCDPELQEAEIDPETHRPVGC